MLQIITVFELKAEEPVGKITFQTEPGGFSLSASVEILPIAIDEAGLHHLRFRVIEPGIILQKIMINTGGLKPSYLGAPQSKRIKFQR